ncbi:glycoside hydrolase family 32 protein [Streptomyces sp. NBC_01803]|uniref:glycoside hydrolase family 32 protein n=1 Tax=Streptomyces sp. NBC_01803 TaxID=2975946 RepID=UPI002DD8E9AA|nr:glycoside hydrolase family 32 protein [Streptomyces sp. NBC_01803]WSA46964.1 GH32 C-terminal domain-containing protein [Streptomyces sp. NBC_01803]
MNNRRPPATVARTARARAVALLLSLSLSLPLTLTAAPPAAADPVSPLADAPSPIPDPVGRTGAWTRTDDGGQRAVSGHEENALALSEQRIGANAVYSAPVTVAADSPYAVGSLVIRATSDGVGGYAAGIDPNLDRVRLFDLATGRDLAPPAAFPASPGTTYQLRIAADGPALRVWVDGTQIIEATDTRYQAGVAGLHAYNGTVVFGAPGLRAVDTNLDGWHTEGAWSATATGWRGQAPADGHVRAVAATRAHDTALRADLTVRDPYAVAALLVRAGADGRSGYAVQADPNLDRLRLYRIEDDHTLGTFSTPITPGEVYRLRVEADGPRLRVYWQTDFLRPDGWAPVISAEDTAHTAGHLGVQSYNGGASFDAITADDLETDLQGWSATAGSWEPDLLGTRGQAAASAAALRTAPLAGADAVIQADVIPATGTAGVVFRAGAGGSGGYELRLDRAGYRVRLLDRASGTELASAEPPVRALRAGVPYRVELRLTGSALRAFVDGAEVFDRSVGAGAGTSLGLAVGAGGTAYFDNVLASAPEEHYTEPYRPSYHYSQRTGNASDPNGLVYYEGEYHLFHQDLGRWAHAVSTDLTHWRSLPIALPESPAGYAWSGSAVVDAADASGLFGGGSGLVAFHTSYDPDAAGGNQDVHVAFSRDRGRSWEWHDGGPVVENPGGPEGNWDFRDPKVVWDAERGRWVMVVAGGDHVRFFTSTDLLDWTYASSFGYGAYVTGGTWECPDFFPLPVDGDPARVRWALMLSTGPARHTDGSAAEYFVGAWDGERFTSETPAGTPLRADFGRDFYAAMSFSGLPDERRVWLGWMSNWDYGFSAPTEPWHGNLSVPRELSLTEVPGVGPRLIQRPVPELDSLRGSVTSRENVTVGPGSPDPLAGVTGSAVEITAEVALPATGAASELALAVRSGDAHRTVVGYDVAGERMFVDRSDSGRTDFTEHFAGRTYAPLATETVGGERRVKLRVFVDAGSVEAFGGDGRAAISSLVFPDPGDTGMSFTANGGSARIISLTVHQLDSVFRVGQWANAPLSAEPDGTFRTDLGELTVTPNGRWTPGGSGLAGEFDRDTTAVSARTLSDTDLRASVHLDGGAASLVLRASADGSDGYYVNLDPNLRVVRLIRKTDGTFDDSGVLAEVPALVRHDTTYAVRVLAEGSRVRVFLDGEQVIDATDGTYPAGHVGLNVFGGRAAYQDAYATEPS